jgi:hypothetical protein
MKQYPQPGYHVDGSHKEAWVVGVMCVISCRERLLFKTGRKRHAPFALCQATHLECWPIQALAVFHVRVRDQSPVTRRVIQTDGLRSQHSTAKEYVEQSP